LGRQTLVWWRNLSPAELLCLLPLHLAVLLAKALRRWREGQLTPFLRGRLNALVVLLRSITATNPTQVECRLAGRWRS
jgi:hypothetical protein